MARTGDFDFPTNDTTWELLYLRRELKRLSDEIEQLKRMRLSKPTSGCGHTFPIWMVVPPGGCTIQCPICGVPRFIHGSMVTR